MEFFSHFGKPGKPGKLGKPGKPWFLVENLIFSKCWLAGKPGKPGKLDKWGCGGGCYITMPRR